MLDTAPATALPSDTKPAIPAETKPTPALIAISANLRAPTATVNPATEAVPAASVTSRPRFCAVNSCTASAADTNVARFLS